MALLFFASALPVAVRVVAKWSPGEASTDQLALECRAEASGIVVAWGVALGLLATVLWLWAVAGVLPELVRGAMCGTGVMGWWLRFGVVWSTRPPRAASAKTIRLFSQFGHSAR